MHFRDLPRYLKEGLRLRLHGDTIALRAEVGLLKEDYVLVKDRLGEAENQIKALEEALRPLSTKVEDFAFLLTVAPHRISDLYPWLQVSKAQNRQDVFALAQSGLKRNGYFVEFGATNGIDVSNTYLLEKDFGWSGILAEPAKGWHSQLRANRACRIEQRCVWRATGEKLAFLETPTAEMSTLKDFTNSDGNSHWRTEGVTYDVDTISLKDMLDQHGAPPQIDFLSLDTEGSEYEILEAFDFSAYQFNTIVCEHNHRKVRSDIFDLLAKNGYRRKFEHFSGWDDWYVKS